MTFRTTVNRQRGVSIGSHPEAGVRDLTQNGGVQPNPGPRGPAGRPLRLRGELQGTLTPLPADAQESDYWILLSPVPDAAPERSNGTAAQQGDWIAYTVDDGWINVGPLTVGGDLSPDAYQYVSETPLASHVINHNLGFKPNVTVFDLNTGRKIEGVELHHSVNQLEIQFLTPRAIEAQLT